MTDVASRAHPLQRLSGAEIDAARVTFEKAGLLSPTTRFAMLALEEPPKDEVLAHRPGDPVDRRVRAVLLDVATGARPVGRRVGDPRRRSTRCATIDPAVDGQPPILLEEFIAVDEIVQGRRRLARRDGPARHHRPRPGAARARCRPATSASRASAAGGMLRVLSFVANRPEDHCWAHPIDGVVAYVDLIERRVVELIDHELLPIPAEEGNFDDPAYVGPGARRRSSRSRSPSRDGPSFTVDGDVVTWEDWRFRVGLRPARGPGAAPDLDPRTGR